ncbi:hypothetical protein CDAR_185231 [Caerostris darwini]|uniref:Uncharacterized protein n=1 Tax=Caerostris darwini TaxID=1538125 RepID=A0AAV4ST65_9ARAC|nr:hypothetical protein CDAR_185231 [Caerostris darwini]
MKEAYQKGSEGVANTLFIPPQQSAAPLSSLRERRLIKKLQHLLWLSHSGPPPHSFPHSVTMATTRRTQNFAAIRGLLTNGSQLVPPPPPRFLPPPPPIPHGRDEGKDEEKEKE